MATTQAAGPKGHLLTGNLREYLQDRIGFLTTCARWYGDMVPLRFPFEKGFLLSNPDCIEYVLVTNSRNFIKPRLLREPFIRRLFGDGLLTSEGNHWLRERRLAQPAFHRESINTYGEVVVACAERKLAAWREGEIRDVHRGMLRLTLDIVAGTLFGADVEEEADRVSIALAGVFERLTSAGKLSWIVDNYLPTRGHRRFQRSVDQLERIIYDIISQRRRSCEDSGDLLSLLLRAQDEDGGSMSDRQLRDEVMTLFLAGHETTALALTWTWYLLAQHPEEEGKLHEELRTLLRGQAPTTADLPRLRYTEMIIEESMRLYPPAWGVGREAIRDCDHRVRAGNQLYLFQWIMHRDERYFESPESFKPGRWADGFERRLPKFAYFLFGGGPRVCIGNSFAMMEAALLLAVIAQRFHIQLVSGQSVALLPSVTLRPRSGIKVVLRKRI